jgi:shikimate dehydrogenase
VVFILNWLLADTIHIAARNPEKTKRITEKIGGRSMALEVMESEPIAADIVINTTSVSDPEESPEMAGRVEKMQAPECKLLVDLNFGRQHNFWETWARRQNIAFMDGLPTLAHQARRSFLLWTGIQMPAEEFRQVADRSGWMTMAS